MISNKSILDFVVNEGPWESEKDYFQCIEKFICSQFQNSKFSIISTQDLEGKEVDDVASKCRFIRNRENLKGVNPKDLIINVFSSPLFNKFNLSSKNLFSINLGKKSNQQFFAIIESTNLQFESGIEENFAKILNMHYQEAIKVEALKRSSILAHIDDVTGLFNQRRLYIDLENQIKNYNETKNDFAVIFIDIDHFKKVNDGHGHLVGTVLLVEMGNLLKHVLREEDLIYRYGGDEFVLILPDVDSKVAKTIGHRILDSVGKHTFSADKDFKLTVSIGIAVYPEHASKKEEILEMADKMMYAAKESGRGRVCTADELFD